MAEEITVIVDDTQEEVSLFVDSGITVDSVFGRTGNVVAVDGDYTTALVPEVTNLYYTEARVSANSAVVLNTAKDGITPAQASEITANTTTNADQANQITTSRFESRCLGQAVDGRIDNYASALANIAQKESGASLLFDAKICGVGVGKLFNLLPFDIYKDFDVVRNGTATYVGSDGLIKTALANVPRIDWTDSANPVSLTEPQGTNLFTYSEDLNNFTLTRSTVSASSIVSPEGINDADGLVATSDSNTHFVRHQSTTVTVGVVYTMSCFVKASDKSFVYLMLETNTPVSSDSCHFDLDNNIVGGVGSNILSSSIEDYGNGWKKITATKTSLGGSLRFGIGFEPSDLTPVFTGDGSTVDGYIWGAQLETGDTATSYIPTEGTQKSRIADDTSILVPDGITSIVETIGGVDQTPITVIPTTYTIPVYNYGSELVTNGDFATDSDWTKGTGWTISSGKAISDGLGSGSSYLSQPFVESGKTYKVTIEIVDYVSGTCKIEMGGTVSVNFTANGIYTYTVLATSSSNLGVKSQGGTFNGATAYVSVKEQLSSGARMNKITMT